MARLIDITRHQTEASQAGSHAHKRRMKPPITVPETHRLIIIGAGGFGSEAAWVAEAMGARWQLLGFADGDPAKKGRVIGASSVLGNIDEAAALLAGEPLWYFCAVGNNSARELLAARAETLGWSPATLIHPSAIIAPDATIGPGTYLGPGSIICPNSRVGAHVIVNVHASIGHDAVIEDFAQICPGARISGNCRVGRLALIGSNATLLPGIVMGTDVVAGANSQVASALEPHVTAVGVPARVICKRPAPASPPASPGDPGQEPVLA